VPRFIPGGVTLIMNRIGSRIILRTSVLALIPFGFLVLGQPDTPVVEHLTVQVIQEYPHDPAAYTQGLVFSDGRLIESTGLYGQSSLREVALATGEVIRSISLASNEFGEGLELVGDRLTLLTWREGVAHNYNRDTFEEVGFFPYSGEGWGLCYDGARFIMSDGSARLTFRSTDTFDIQTSVTVTLDGEPRDRLNELEYVDGYVYANVFLTRTIVKIRPSDGRVVAVIDASLLDPGGNLQYGDVLNGIAYDPVDSTFLLTGKRWPKLFRVILVPAAGN